MQKKIVYITNQICGPGGLERVLSIKASYFADNMDYEVHILTLNQYDLPLFYNFSSKIIYHDIIAKRSSFKYFLEYKKGINRIVNQVCPDVICVCDDGLKGLFVPLYLSRKTPIIYERHTVKKVFESSEKSNLVNRLKYGFKNRLADWGSKLFDKFIVLTNQNANEWPKADISVIPNPISFYTSDPSNLKSKKVISVGTMSHVKGFDLLLKAWRTVIDKHPDWELEIYGKPLLRNELVQLSQELGIENNVEFNDPVVDIEAKYRQASIYVLSSRFEGFGMVLIEAMACGLPCVSFNCPSGPADIITDNEDGYLVTANDINLLSEKIISLIENETTRQLMGTIARENVKRYMPEQIVGKWDTLFKELIIS